MLGREVFTPVDLVYPLPSKDVESTHEYVNSLEESMAEAHETARRCLKSYQQHMKIDHDVRLNQIAYAVGDIVFVLNTAGRKGKAKKLLSQWNGPIVVQRKYSLYLYKVRMKSKIMNVNHDQMKHYKGRDLPNWLVKAREESAHTHVEEDVELEVYCLCR
ncbi:uncharacterized protein LOC128235253 [Mya arenaria]|uniref:uncharacterized protein LOC128235253 n=1 Tax=Mya arenaria TaxID=6604 RepID=UPI0022E54F75|nr:uncharacterized protein LOC128235253 [Mya arenaria]